MTNEIMVEFRLKGPIGNRLTKRGNEVGKNQLEELCLMRVRPDALPLPGSLPNPHDRKRLDRRSLRRGLAEGGEGVPGRVPRWESVRRRMG